MFFGNGKKKFSDILPIQTEKNKEGEKSEWNCIGNRNVNVFDNHIDFCGNYDRYFYKPLEAGWNDGDYTMYCCSNCTDIYGVV